MLRLHRSLGKSFSEPSNQQAHRDVTQAARLSQSQLQEMGSRALFGARDSKDSSEAQDDQAPLTFTCRDGWISDHAADSQGDWGGSGR